MNIMKSLKSYEEMKNWKISQVTYFWRTINHYSKKLGEQISQSTSKNSSCGQRLWCHLMKHLLFFLYTWSDLELLSGVQFASLISGKTFLLFKRMWKKSSFWALNAETSSEEKKLWNGRKEVLEVTRLLEKQRLRAERDTIKVAYK